MTLEQQLAAWIFIILLSIFGGLVYILWERVSDEKRNGSKEP